MVTQIKNPNEFTALIKEFDGETVVILEFWAKWCKACSILTPELEKLAKSNPVFKFFSADVDDCEDLASEYNVIALPTICVIKDNTIVETIIGAKVSALHKLLKKVHPEGNLIIPEEPADLEAQIPAKESPTASKKSKDGKGKEKSDAKKDFSAVETSKKSKEKSKEKVDEKKDSSTVLTSKKSKEKNKENVDEKKGVSAVETSKKTKEGKKSEKIEDSKETSSKPTDLPVNKDEDLSDIKLKGKKDKKSNDIDKSENNKEKKPSAKVDVSTAKLDTSTDQVVTAKATTKSEEPTKQKDGNSSNNKEKNEPQNKEK